MYCEAGCLHLALAPIVLATKASIADRTAGHGTSNYPDPAPYTGMRVFTESDVQKTQRGKQDVTFTAVGYGLQKSFPSPGMVLASNVKVRYIATPSERCSAPLFEGLGPRSRRFQ